MSLKMKICPSTAVLWIDEGSPETKYMHKMYIFFLIQKFLFLVPGTFYLHRIPSIFFTRIFFSGFGLVYLWIRIRLYENSGPFIVGSEFDIYKFKDLVKKTQRRSINPWHKLLQVYNSFSRDYNIYYIKFIPEIFCPYVY